MLIKEIIHVYTDNQDKYLLLTQMLVIVVVVPTEL
jgi:hypothetical protein